MAGPRTAGRLFLSFPTYREGDMENRNKAEFKAIRERVGLTQSKLADAVGVQVRAVKRWESPDAPQRPPKDAWDVLDELLDRQRDIVDEALRRAESAPDDVVHRLTYRTGAGDDHPALAGTWRVRNATARAVATALEAEGYTVEFVPAEHQESN